MFRVIKFLDVSVPVSVISYQSALLCFEWADHFKNGYLQETTLVWAEGRSEWQPLSAVTELMSRISGAEVDNSVGGNIPKLSVFFF